MKCYENAFNAGHSDEIRKITLIFFISLSRSVADKIKEIVELSYKPGKNSLELYHK